MKLDEQRIKKILIIRPDMIGDVVLITPAIAALKIKFPAAKISVLAQEYTRGVLEGNPDVSEVLFDEMRAGKARGFVEYFGYVSKIRRMKFDLCVNYYVDDIRFAALPFLAGIRYRVGDRAKLINGLFSNFGTHIKWRNLSRHIVELNLDLLGKLGINEKDPELKVPVLPAAQRSLEEKLSAKGASEGKMRITLQLGTGGSNKSLGAGDYARIADSILLEFDCNIILCGGKREAALSKEVMRLAENKPVNMAGELELPELVALIKSSSAFISVDTGPMHIAAAVKTPVLAIFPTKFVKPVKWGPWRTTNIIIRPKTECALPCFPRTCGSRQCVEDLDISDVAGKLKDLLNGGGNRDTEASFKDWFKKSLSVLVIGTANNDASARANLLRKELESLGIKVLCEETSPWPSIRSIKKLFKLISGNEVNVIHSIGKRVPFNVFIAYLLSETFLLTPAIPVKDTGIEFVHSRDILNFYLNRTGSNKQVK